MEKSEYLDLYRQMFRIRRVEETAAELYQKGEIGGFLHLYIGEEAVATGIMAARQPQDHVITAYRDHGVALTAGIEMKVVFSLNCWVKLPVVRKAGADPCIWPIPQRISGVGMRSSARIFPSQQVWRWPITSRKMIP